MMNTHFTKILCLTLALQFVVPAQVFATPTLEQQRQEITAKARELLNQPGTQDAEFRSADKSPLSRDQFLSNPPTEFYMIPSGQLNGAGYGIRIKSEQTSNGFRIAIAVMDQALQNTFSRRALTLTSSQSSAQRLVEIERAVNTMVQSLQTAAVKGKSRAVASDNASAVIRRVLYAGYVIGMIAGIAGYLEFVPTSEPSKVMWGGFALLAISAAIHYIAFGDSVRNN